MTKNSNEFHSKTLYLLIFNITHVLNFTVIIINMKDQDIRFNGNFN
jgi:hypothetical protein